jgi:hypothetical protein
MARERLSARWSRIAAEIRALAANEREGESKHMLLRIAADYDFLTKRAEAMEAEP